MPTEFLEPLERRFEHRGTFVLALLAFGDGE